MDQEEEIEPHPQWDLAAASGPRSGRCFSAGCRPGKKAARGKLRFKPNGNVVGRLNGKRVRYRAGK